MMLPESSINEFDTERLQVTYFEVTHKHALEPLIFYAEYGFVSIVHSFFISVDLSKLDIREDRTI